MIRSSSTMHSNDSGSLTRTVILFADFKKRFDSNCILVSEFCEYASYLSNDNLKEGTVQ